MPHLRELLSASASRTPDAVAVLEKDQPPTRYAQLEAQASAVSRALSDIGVSDGDRVGFCAPKSAAGVAALFGILGAGAAYVPVDPAAPAARSAGICTDCGVRAILVASDSAEALQNALGRARYSVDKAASQATGYTVLSAADSTTKSTGLAYILYTSGSTGVPKGVAHSHASALAFVDWCSAQFAPGPKDRFSSHAPFHFDLLILDLYLPIKHGASVRLIGADEAKQPGALAALIGDEALTFWYSTPTVLRAMVEHTDLASFDHSSLRVVCFAGEVFATRHLKALADIWPKPRYYNLFGPTETNVCTFHQLPDPRSMTDHDAVPIGHASSGDVLRITAPDGSVVRDGEEGELLVRGASVMRGYWNAPDLDAQVFCEHDGHRWYRTCDMVAARADGALMFRGRRDRMIKRRGYRVELGEIEAALLRHEDISQSAAVAVDDASGEVAIVAFYAWNGSAAPSMIAMKRYSNSALPAYMIPDRFVRMQDLPQTSTAKVDYQSLKEAARGLFT